MTTTTQSVEYEFNYIYKIVRISDGKFYYGLHSTSKMNDSYFGSGVYLRRSVAKYGRDAHIMDVLEFCQTRAELDARESEIVTPEMLAHPLCMNLRLGGAGLALGRRNTEETRALMSESQTKRAARHKADGTEEKHIEYLRKLNTGKQMSAETVAKQVEGRRKTLEANGGKHPRPRSEAFRESVRERHKGKSYCAAHWEITDANTGEVHIIRNLSAWRLERGLAISNDGLGHLRIPTKGRGGDPKSRIVNPILFIAIKINPEQPAPSV